MAVAIYQQPFWPGLISHRREHVLRLMAPAALRRPSDVQGPLLRNHLSLVVVVLQEIVIVYADDCG